jgi:hypothetical protein
MKIIELNSAKSVRKHATLYNTFINQLRNRFWYHGFTIVYRYRNTALVSVKETVRDHYPDGRVITTVNELSYDCWLDDAGKLRCFKAV